MYKVKVYNKRSFTKLLEDNDFHCNRTHGSHFIYKDKNGRTISFNKDLNRMVAQRLIKENNLMER